MTNTVRYDFNEQQKIQVFVSSKCGDHGAFDDMRSRLADLLMESGVFSSYLWERGGASTMPASSLYVSQINLSDICVFVIDNAIGVTPGVQKEIDQALNTNKRSLFYFCSHQDGDKTELQKQFEGPDGPTFHVVNSLEEVPNRVMLDLQADVMGLYHRWCSHDVEFSANAQQLLPTVSSGQIPKSAVKEFPGLRDVFSLLVFNRHEGVDPLEGLDAESAKLARALFINLNIENFDSAGLLSVAQTLLPSEYYRVVEIRWSAICQYYQGQKQSALKTLDKAHELAKSLKLEEWFKNDILIDLRNISSEINESEIFDGKYQKALTDGKQSIVYPLLDRAVSDSLDDIETDRLKEGIQNYSTVTFGANTLRFFDNICKAFAIAACFGSLTHISQTAKRLRTAVFYLCNKYNDASLNTTLLKLTLVCGKQGDAEKTIQAFNNICFDSDSQSASSIFDFCSRYKFLGNNNVALFEAFGTVGLYLSNAEFVKASSVFTQRCETVISNPPRWADKPKAIFHAFQVNDNRLSPEWMLDYTKRAIDLQSLNWAQPALRFVVHTTVDYGLVEPNTIKALLASVLKLAKLKESAYESLIVDAASRISSECSQDFFPLLEEIVQNLSESLQEHYRTVVGSKVTPENMAKLVECDIEGILKSNKSQGVGGIFGYGRYDHKNALRHIKAMENPPLSLGKSLYKACLGTLSSPTFDRDGKVDACEVMCALIGIFSNRRLQLNKATSEVLANKVQIANVESFGRASKLLFCTYMDVLFLLVGNRSEQDLCTDIACCYHSDVYTQAHVGTALSYLVKARGGAAGLKILRGVTFSYACFLAKSRHFQLDWRGLELISEFLIDEDFQQPAAQTLFDAYAGQSPRGKQIIIDSIVGIRAFNPELADQLRSKVARDNTTTAVRYLEKIEAEAADCDKCE